jgi:hypothetical protein
MAKQFTVQSTDGVGYLLPSSSVMMINNGNGTNVVYANGVLVSLTVLSDLVDLANTGGTEQVSATTIRVNESIQTSPIPMSFPVNGFTVNESTLSGSNAVILYAGTRYYVSETQAALLEIANSGATSTPTLDDVMAEGSTLTSNRSIVVDTVKELSIINAEATTLFNAGPAGTTLAEAVLVQFAAGGSFRMVDTATEAVMNVVITNGAFVITGD